MGFLMAGSFVNETVPFPARDCTWVRSVYDGYCSSFVRFVVGGCG